jgi:hypothetical protein
MGGRTYAHSDQPSVVSNVLFKVLTKIFAKGGISQLSCEYPQISTNFMHCSL